MSDGLAAAPRRRAPIALAICAALVAVWPFALAGVRGRDVYLVLGPYGALVALVAAALCLWLAAPVVARARAARDLALGAGVGAVMTAATYAAFAVVERVAPALARETGELYSAAQQEALPTAIGWTLVVIAAEELLWRGALLGSAARVLGPRAAVALSLATYVGVQVASGAWVAALAALVCGAIWTAERVATRSLVAPAISHVIWTITVVHLCPVVGR